MTVANAIELASAIRDGAGPAAPDPATPGRVVAIGDPQTSAERFLGVLAHHGLLAGDGWLARDVRLISMGDHFDYQVSERERARVEGVLILGWLAAHAREQVAILFGNHDAARVMELVAVDDHRFAAAAELARAMATLPRPARIEAENRFRQDFPDLATPGYVARDYNAFTVEQRRLVQRLLLDRRYDLALARPIHERAGSSALALLTHAGVTIPQLAQLGLRDERNPAMIASALNARLNAAVSEVAQDWQDQRAVPLSLEPLYVEGREGHEAGGLLVHRPADPERPGADPAWELASRSPRRFDPRSLPRGLVQIVGHTGHRKAHAELPRWGEPGMDAAVGGLRTLRVTADGTVSYARGISRGDPEDAVVWMIDPEMHGVASPSDVEVLELATR